jgi:phospholipase A1
MRISLLICLSWLLALTPLYAAENLAASASRELQQAEAPLPAPSGQLIDQRRQIDKTQGRRPLVLVSHKPNYLIGSYYFIKPQEGPFKAQFPTQDINVDALELKFQLSLKTLLFSDLLGKTGDLWAGYTNRSFWQAFNHSRSSPFRETNHEPEAWFDFSADLNLGGISYKGMNLGMVHQSNGQFGELSRSWNRIYGLFMFQTESLYFAIKPWWRITEAAGDDDNPEIEKYLGSFEFYTLKEWNEQTLGIMLRNNLRLNNDNHGAVQLDYTFPLHNQLRGYVQWFHGYGESLIDYDHEVNTFGVGLMLSNWL